MVSNQKVIAQRRCVKCGVPIPARKRRDSVTCGLRCYRALAEQRRCDARNLKRALIKDCRRCRDCSGPIEWKFNVATLRCERCRLVRIRARSRKSYTAHTEERRAGMRSRAKARYERDPELYCSRSRAYQLRHPERVRATSRRRMRKLLDDAPIAHSKI